MRASFASLLITSLVLTSPAFAGPKKGRAKKAPKKKATPTAPAPAPDPAPTPDGATPALGDPADATTPANATPPTTPATPAPPAPAPAAGPAPGSKEAKAKAKALQKEATKLYNVQQYARAAELYQEAYLLDANPVYLYASAQSQRLGGDCTKALQSYQAYLRANPPEAERAKATANIERCEQELRDREAAVNAEQITAPYEVPAPPPPPPEEKPLPPPPPPPPPPEKSNIVGHVMLGLGVVALGGGSYLFYSGRKALSDHNSAPTYDDYIAGLADVDSAKQKQTFGLIGAGAGAALVGGAILYYVLRSDSKEAPVQATLTPNNATVSLQGTF